MLIPLAAFLEDFKVQWGKEIIFAILWLALVVSLGAYSMMFFLLRTGSATKVASLAYLIPPTTMITAYFMFSERLSAIDVFGVSLAVLAVWLVIADRGSASQNQPLETGYSLMPQNPDLPPQSFRNFTMITMHDHVDPTRPANHISGSLITHINLHENTLLSPEEFHLEQQRIRELEKLLMIKLNQ